MYDFTEEGRKGDYIQFLELLLEIVKRLYTNENINHLFSQAAEKAGESGCRCTKSRLGNLSNSCSFSSRLVKLKEKNRSTWARLLYDIAEGGAGEDLYRKFKDFSPFEDVLLARLGADGKIYVSDHEIQSILGKNVGAFSQDMILVASFPSREIMTF